MIDSDLTYTGKSVPLGVSAGDEDIETWIYRNADAQSDSFLKIVVVFSSQYLTLMITTYCISKSNQLGKKANTSNLSKQKERRIRRYLLCRTTHQFQNATSRHLGAKIYFLLQMIQLIGPTNLKL